MVHDTSLGRTMHLLVADSADLANELVNTIEKAWNYVHTQVCE